MRLACFVLGLLLKVSAFYLFNQNFALLDVVKTNDHRWLAHHLLQAVQGRWTIIIDAGSSGSRVHVYEVGRSASGLAQLTHPASLKVSPGLSAFAEAPQYAGQSLLPLLSFAALQVSRHAKEASYLKRSSSTACP